MNEFTKEELLWLYDETEGCYDEENIRQKLKSMIDHYCEHNDKQYYERVNLYECNKCGMTTLG